MTYEPTSRVDPYAVYEEAYTAFEKEIIFMQKKFTEVELNFDVIEFAAKSAIMASYCLYGTNFLMKL